MSTFTLSRHERLRGDSTISALFSNGRGGVVMPFRYVWRAVEHDEEKATVSVLFAAPKKCLKRANKRNVIKRRAREAYRLNKLEINEVALEKGRRVELALVYRSKEIATYAEVESAVKKILESVKDKL